VTAWYLLATQTVDEEMAEALERKRELIGAVTDGRVHDTETIVDAVVRKLRDRPYRHLHVVA
jgi:SWI/SNF-related matrix-associated actin-dependent regulator 1 of chromatin subfamily A